MRVHARMSSQPTGAPLEAHSARGRQCGDTHTLQALREPAQGALELLAFGTLPHLEHAALRTADYDELGHRV